MAECGRSSAQASNRRCVMAGGGKDGGGSAPYQNELAGMYAGQNMLTMAQRNPYAAAMFRPGSELGDTYKKMFGTSALPANQPFRLDPIGSYSMAASRIYGGAQPELNQPNPAQFNWIERSPLMPSGQQAAPISAAPGTKYIPGVGTIQLGGLGGSRGTTRRVF